MFSSRVPRGGPFKRLHLLGRGDSDESEDDTDTNCRLRTAVRRFAFEGDSFARLRCCGRGDSVESGDNNDDTGRLGAAVVADDVGVNNARLGSGVEPVETQCDSFLFDLARHDSAGDVLPSRTGRSGDGEGDVASW